MSTYNATGITECQTGEQRQENVDNTTKENTSLNSNDQKLKCFEFETPINPKCGPWQVVNQTGDSLCSLHALNAYLGTVTVHLSTIFEDLRAIVSAEGFDNFWISVNRLTPRDIGERAKNALDAIYDPRERVSEYDYAIASRENMSRHDIDQQTIWLWLSLRLVNILGKGRFFLFRPYAYEAWSVARDSAWTGRLLTHTAGHSVCFVRSDADCPRSPDTWFSLDSMKSTQMPVSNAHPEDSSCVFEPRTGIQLSRKVGGTQESSQKAWHSWNAEYVKQSQLQ